MKRLREIFGAMLGGAVMIVVTVIICFPVYKNLAIAESPVVSTATVLRLVSHTMNDNGIARFNYTITFAGQEVPYFTGRRHEIGEVFSVVYCSTEPRWYIKAKVPPTWGGTIFGTWSLLYLILLPLVWGMVIHSLLQWILKNIRSKKALAG